MGVIMCVGRMTVGLEFNNVPIVRNLFFSIDLY
jgi:hypothetical protein